MSNIYGESSVIAGKIQIDVLWLKIKKNGPQKAQQFNNENDWQI